MREEPKNQRFERSSIRWGPIPGDEFSEHARRIVAVVAISAIWIGFSPQQGVRDDKTAPESEHSTITPGLFAAPLKTTSAVPTRPRGAVTPLANRLLIIPVKGVTPDELRDSFNDKRPGGRRHKAIDILAERSTPVLAVEGGTVARIDSSRLGGLSLYQYDPTGRYVYYYAHLDRYAPGLFEGERLRQGDLIGYVGESGNAETPHLHFAISFVGSQERWWRGKPIDPYPLLRHAEIS